MFSLDRLEQFFDVRRLAVPGASHDTRVELLALDAGQHQQRALVLVQAFDGALDHALNGLGQLVENPVQRSRRFPRTVNQLEPAMLFRVPQHIHDEERASPVRK